MVKPTIAVIGAGSIGTRHAANLNTLGVDVVQIPWREFDAAQFSARRDLDGVVIATSTSIRLELVTLCAQMNLPFYAEKPLAWTTALVDEIHEVATPVAERSMIGFMMRYHPAVRALAEKDLSNIYSFTMEIGHDVRQWRPNWSFSASYAAKPEGGGVLLDLSHEIDLAVALFPNMDLQSSTCLGHAEFPGVDFATKLELTSQRGLFGSVNLDYLSPVSVRKSQFHGLTQSWELDFGVPELATRTPAGRQAVTYDFERNDMFLDAMRDFLALVSGKATANPLAPRFDRMFETSSMIARAWCARKFVGNIAREMG